MSLAPFVRAALVATEMRVKLARCVARGALRAMLGVRGANECGEVALDGADVGCAEDEEPLAERGLSVSVITRVKGL